MITRLGLKRFKNFQSAELVCGPFSLLLGTNASGKSNLRDAFRFLHGIGRGYRLAEIFGEKYEAGSLQWQGIRGGISEITYLDTPTFELRLEFSHWSPDRVLPTTYHYQIEIAPLKADRPRVVSESLCEESEPLYATRSDQADPQHVKITIRPGGNYRKGHTPLFIADQPVLSQILDEEGFASRADEGARDVRRGIQAALTQLRAIRFLDLNPEAMREPSFRGQPLGDRGENLSSALLDICQDASRKSVLEEWVQALTPMDARDFQFKPDQVGRVLLTLVEADGHPTSAYAASDGTLRFLAIAAALLTDGKRPFYFIEELENGIHPTRLHLLVELIENSTGEEKGQVIATTHSPQLLRLVDRKTLTYTSLVYRLEDQPAGNIQQLTALPEPARDVLEQQDRAQLYESGWFEDTVAYLAAEENA